MNSIIRIVVPAKDDLDVAAIRQGWEIAKAISVKYEKQLLILIPEKRQMRGTSLARAIGPDCASDIEKGKSSVGLQTLRTLNRTQCVDKVLFAVYAEDTMMNKVDSINGMFAVIALPAQKNDLSHWVTTWNAHIWGEEKKKHVFSFDAVTVVALEMLTDGINLSHALLNTRDKEHVKNTINILLHHGHKANGEDIKAWAVQHHWIPSAANELKSIWEKMSSLINKPHLSNADQAKKTYAFWIEKAKG